MYYKIINQKSIPKYLEFKINTNENVLGKKMKEKNKDKKRLRILEILEDVKVVYTNDIEDYLELIQVTKKGLKIGRKKDNKFLFFGFIPIQNIKQIKNNNIKKISEKEIIDFK